MRATNVHVFYAFAVNLLVGSDTIVYNCCNSIMFIVNVLICLTHCTVSTTSCLSYVTQVG